MDGFPITIQIRHYLIRGHTNNNNKCSQSSLSSVTSRHNAQHQEPKNEIASTTLASAFDATNVYVRSTRVPSDTWNRIVPNLFSVGPLKSPFDSNMDVTVTFSNASEGAQKLVDRFVFPSTKKKEEAFEHLQECLELFQNLYYESNRCNYRHTPLHYRARIVATRGVGGGKCTRFHVDHVPIRLVCALEGPGVVYIDECSSKAVVSSDNTIDWRHGLINASEETNTEKVNNDILRRIASLSIDVKHARTGDAVVLLGKQWEDTSIVGSSQGTYVRAAAHRSPTLTPFQGRVLLTVDVIP